MLHEMMRLLFRQNGGQRAFQFRHLTRFNLASSQALATSGLSGSLANTGKCCALADFVDMALAKDVELLATVRALGIAHVFHKAQNGHIHHLGHVDGLSTIMPTSSCGEVTRMMPSNGRD